MTGANPLNLHGPSITPSPEAKFKRRIGICLHMIVNAATPVIARVLRSVS